MVRRTRPQVRNCAPGNLEIPGSRCVRPGMTWRDCELDLLLALGAEDDAFPFLALDAGFDEAVQDLDDDAALLDHDRRNRAAGCRRRNLLKAKRRHGVSPRR